MFFFLSQEQKGLEILSVLIQLVSLFHDVLDGMQVSVLILIIGSYQRKYLKPCIQYWRSCTEFFFSAKYQQIQQATPQFLDTISGALLSVGRLNRGGNNQL